MEKLPQNELKEEKMEKDEKDETEKSSNDTENFSVASQETLFNLHPKKEEIKRIDEDEKESDTQFFFQYDLFGQNVKSVKNPAVRVEKVEAYSNKYQKYDNNQADFEPQKNASENSFSAPKISLENLKNSVKKGGSFFKKMPIERDVSQKNASENSLKSNFDISVLVDESKNFEEQSLPSPQPSTNEKNLLADEKNLQTESEHKDDFASAPFENEQNENEKLKIEREPSAFENVIFETNDYRAAIGELFKNSQKIDPYEQNKFISFKEIFPQTKVQKAPPKTSPKSEIDEFVQSSSKGDIDENDIETLSNLFHLQGIKIRTHKPAQNIKKSRPYTDKNKLHMVSSWLTALLMAFEIIFAYIFLKNAGNLIRSQLLLFFLGGALTLSIFIVPTLENLFDRYKLVVIKNDFKKGITLRLLTFIIISVVTFGICLSLGMQGLTQIEYMAFWLLPILYSSNIIVAYLIYSFLLKQKYFNS